MDKNEKLQLDLKLKDTYSASIIHELRNPLNAVLGSISLLKVSRFLSSPED
jgi:signal transduction histidine kinase